MFEMPPFHHITITPPNIDPNSVMDKFLTINNSDSKFIPCVSTEKAKEKQKLISEKNKTKGIEKMTLDEFVEYYWGFNEFNKKTGYYGYLGNLNDHYENYVLGEEIFINLKCERKSQEVNKNIDWNKMREEAHERAVDNSLTYDKPDKEDFIKIREVVHLRPYSFVGKDGVWHELDQEDEDVKLSLELYQKAWDDALKTAEPDDIFTHWRTIE